MRLVVNLAMLYPYLAALVDVHVFDKHHFVGIESIVCEFVERILDIGVNRIYPDAIAHGLHCAIKHDVSLNIVKLGDAIIAIDDCLCLVLLLEYAKQHGITELESKIHARTDLLKGGEARDKDRYWPLIHYVWSAPELKSEGQGFLSELKRSGMSFLSFA